MTIAMTYTSTTSLSYITSSLLILSIAILISLNLLSTTYYSILQSSRTDDPSTTTTTRRGIELNERDDFSGDNDKQLQCVSGQIIGEKYELIRPLPLPLYNDLSA